MLTVRLNVLHMLKAMSLLESFVARLFPCQTTIPSMYFS
jgi:hypothetical protein